MMNIIEVPMHRKNGTTVQLIDLLGAIPTNNWVWTIMEFDGVGEMPNQMPVAEFEKQVRILPDGFIMTWPEMQYFAQSIDYSIDCLIVAVKRKDDLNTKQLFLDDFRGCEIGLRAIDSGVWVMAALDKDIFKCLVEIALGEGRNAQ